ncbi:MAG: hypothetical protein KAV87_45430 [Desulfobacteraceae bacterium]|nr:hypothetical protein [Desulfobacteraceae bacterium]
MGRVGGTNRSSILNVKRTGILARRQEKRLYEQACCDQYGANLVHW